MITVKARLTAVIGVLGIVLALASGCMVTNSPPVAVFTCDPPFGPAPLSVSFDASASHDSDGSIVSYQWAFGDGGSGSGVTVTHTYTSAGTYTTQLTVTDDNGATDFSSVMIAVAMVEPPGGTEVGGMITEDTRWSKAGSPYILTTSLGVLPGVTLTIESGTTVKIGNAIRLQIEGTLKAAGTVLEPIEFTTLSEPSFWAGIEFLGSGSSSVLRHCIFRHASFAIDLKGGGNIPEIAHVRIEECGYGLYSTYGYTSSPISVLYCLISGTDTGIMLRVSDQGSLSIRNCTITTNRIGIRCNYSGGSVNINYNNIYGNSKYNVEGANLLDGEEVAIDATHNWWGTTDLISIESGIYDKNDDLEYGYVEYLPILTAIDPEAPAP